MNLPRNKREMLMLLLKEGGKLENLNSILFSFARQDDLDAWFIDNWNWLHQDFGLRMVRKNSTQITILVNDIEVYFYSTQDREWNQACRLCRCQG